MNYKLLDNYNTPNTVITNNSIPNGYTVCDGITVNGTYEKFLDSLDEVKCKKLLMTHLPSKINIAKKFFDGYLTEEELQERQYAGRFWDIDIGLLFILADDDTLLVIYIDGDVSVYPYDVKQYNIVNAEKGFWSIDNIKKARILSQSSSNCEIEILGNKGEFNLIYSADGQDDIILLIKILPI